MEHIYIQLKIYSHKLDNAVLTADDFTATIDLPKRLWELHKRYHNEEGEGDDLNHRSNLMALTNMLLERGRERFNI